MLPRSTHLFFEKKVTYTIHTIGSDHTGLETPCRRNQCTTDILKDLFELPLGVVLQNHFNPTSNEGLHYILSFKLTRV